MKLGRARRHLEEYLHEHAAWKASQPYAIDFEDNAETGQREWKVNRVTDPPAGLPVIIGDLVHNLRAALDHLACQVVLANGGEIRRSTQFPIARSQSDYVRIRNRQLAGASSEAIHVVDGIAPYPGGNEALVKLHDLDITDKHKLLLVVGAFSNRVQFNVGGGQRLAIRPAERTLMVEGATLFGAVPEGPDLDPSFEAMLVFATDPEGDPIGIVVGGLGVAVEDAVQRLEPLLR
jgi:hypothetical protein